MLPTFVIGLREGLEAVLVVSIIATFLRRNGASLRPLWYGVGAAVALSVGVGVTLKVVEQNLRQRQQEGMETVIGLVAVVFVTGMVLWMATHARFIKRDLEGAAGRALDHGTSVALVAMVFLAVLREGVETSVFLLATFQAASSTLSASLGAVIGILAAVALGYAMFSGGVRLDLRRFFSVTSVFLILVAAGLVLSALRTGHEAGWVTIGQGRTVDLSWLAPAGTIRAALVTGVLGIPADPRVVEVLGWACYLVPMLVLTVWPRRLRPSATATPRVRLGAAAGLAVAAVALLVAVPLPHADVAPVAPLAGGGSATVNVAGVDAHLDATSGGRHERVELMRPVTDGAGTTSWSAVDTAVRALPHTLTLTRLLRYTGHRVPVGLDIQRSPGPYDATWADHTRLAVTTYDGGLVSASRSGGLVLTLRGGGLTSERVLTVTDPATEAWHVLASHAGEVRAELATTAQTRGDRALWKYWLPAFLVLLAGWLAITGHRGRRAARDPRPPGGDGAPDSPPAHAGRPGRKHHVSSSH